MSVQSLYQKLCSAPLQNPVLEAFNNGDICMCDIANGKNILEYAILSAAYKCNPKRIKTLIARNLPRDVKIQELREIFEAYGPVRDIYIPKNSDPSSPYYGTIKGFALIKFLDADGATKACIALKSVLEIRNHLVAIEMAKEDRQIASPNKNL
jgi:RNA recognition motif-containing protein